MHSLCVCHQYAVKQSELGNYTLWVSVWHHEKFKRNKFLGEVRLQLAHITLTDESILQSHELQEVQVCMLAVYMASPYF